jgi:uncharacterized protein (TIRG00374 family)
MGNAGEVSFSWKEIALDGAVSLAIVVAIFYMLGPQQIIATLAGVDLYLLFLAIVFLFIMYLVMVMRQWIILRDLGVNAEFIGLLRMHFVGMFLSDFTPARAGYLATAYGMNRQLGIDEGKSTVAVVGVQIYDFLLKVVAGTLGLFYILNTFLRLDNGYLLFIGAVVVLAMTVFMSLLMFSNKFLRMFAFSTRLPIVGNFSAKILGIFEKAQAHSDVLIRKSPELLVLLALSWMSKALSWYFVAKSLGITITAPIHEVVGYMFLQPILTILEFLPTPTLAGLGLSEGGSIMLFSVFGIGAVQAAAFVFLARIKTIALNLVSVGDTYNVLKSLKGDVHRHTHPYPLSFPKRKGLRVSPPKKN